MSAQHDRERNAFRYLAEDKVEKAYFELKNGKKHTDPAEKAFISTLCLLKEDKINVALTMAEKAVELGLPFERFLTEPRDWLAPFAKASNFSKWKNQMQPSLDLIHGPMVGQVTDNSASFWFRTDGACEVAVKIKGHSGRESILDTKEEGYVGVVRSRWTFAGNLFCIRYFYKWYEKYEDESREFLFRTFPEATEGAKFTIAFGGCSGFVPEYESVWELIAGHEPRAMLMLGDNVYIDDPEDVKWTGDYCYSRRHSRPEWKKLVAKTSMHAIYDDHDFGMDDCVPGSNVDQPAWKMARAGKFYKQLE